MNLLATIVTHNCWIAFLRISKHESNEFLQLTFTKGGLLYSVLPFTSLWDLCGYGGCLSRLLIGCCYISLSNLGHFVIGWTKTTEYFDGFCLFVGIFAFLATLNFYNRKLFCYIGCLENCNLTEKYCILSRYLSFVGGLLVCYYGK